MDKTKDLQDLSEEIHATVELDVGEDDNEEMLDLIDQEIANDEIQKLPDGSKMKQLTEVRNKVVEKKKKAVAVDDDDDMRSMLAGL